MTSGLLNCLGDYGEKFDQNPANDIYGGQISAKFCVPMDKNTKLPGILPVC
jgi:hypothetical protein